MTTEITMPKLSDTMTEGNLGAWRKHVGERIERGDIIAEVETDKATMDLEAFTSGILLEQRVQAGELVPVGTVIGLIGEAGDMAAQQTTAPPTAPQTPALQPHPPLPSAQPQPPVATTIERSEPHGGAAAPIVRRRAAELGIDLALVAGSGPDGRVMLEDLERHALTPAPAEQGTPVQPPLPVTTAVPPGTDVQPLSRMRSAIAKVTGESWRTIPHFYLTREIEMDQAEQAIRNLKSEGVSVLLNALIMSAAATALAEFPGLNACYVEGGRVNYPVVNLTFAVALTDGLQMPVIRNAAAKGVRELTVEASRLADHAHQGLLTQDEISGGSFSISNLGMYGVDSLASIVMPGQAAILGLGTVTERPIVRDGAVVIARMLTATLSCDHRIIDGATAAAFLNEFKRLLEHPAELPA